MLSKRDKKLTDVMNNFTSIELYCQPADISNIRDAEVIKLKHFCRTEKRKSSQKNEKPTTTTDATNPSQEHLTIHKLKMSGC